MANLRNINIHRLLHHTCLFPSRFSCSFSHESLFNLERIHLQWEKHFPLNSWLFIFVDIKQAPKLTHAQQLYSYTQDVVPPVILADEALIELVHHSAQHGTGIIGKVQISDLHHRN